MHRSAVHEKWMAPFRWFPTTPGETHHLFDNFRILGGHVRFFSLVCLQVVQNWLWKIRERFVVIPERQLFFAAR